VATGESRSTTAWGEQPLRVGGRHHSVGTIRSHHRVAATPTQIAEHSAASRTGVPWFWHGSARTACRNRSPKSSGPSPPGRSSLQSLTAGPQARRSGDPVRHGARHGTGWHSALGTSVGEPQPGTV